MTVVNQDLRKASTDNGTGVRTVVRKGSIAKESGLTCYYVPLPDTFLKGSSRR